MWAAWAQMLVALAALAFTVVESRRSRREQRVERLAAAAQRRAEREEEDRDRRLRAMPNLFGTWKMDSPQDSLEFVLKNCGLGPARISEYKVTFRGSDFDGISPSTLEIICQQLGISSRSDGHFESLVSGTSLAPGETATLLSMYITRRSSNTPPVNEIAAMFTFHISYFSIYGDFIDDSNVGTLGGVPQAK